MWSLLGTAISPQLPSTPFPRAHDPHSWLLTVETLAEARSVFSALDYPTPWATWLGYAENYFVDPGRFVLVPDGGNDTTDPLTSGELVNAVNLVWLTECQKAQHCCLYLANPGYLGTENVHTGPCMVGPANGWYAGARIGRTNVFFCKSRADGVQAVPPLVVPPPTITYPGELGRSLMVYCLLSGLSLRCSVGGWGHHAHVF